MAGRRAAAGRSCSQPNGRVEVLARVRRTGDDEFVLDTDAGFGEQLAARLARFKIRVKVDIEPVAPSEEPAPFADDAARVEAGWPAMGSEIVPGETIPAETGVTVAAVDFKKGCYPGQELVERMDSRGPTRPAGLRILDVADGAAAGRSDRGRRPRGRHAHQRRRPPGARLRQARRRARHPRHRRRPRVRRSTSDVTPIALRSSGRSGPGRRVPGGGR